MFKIYERLKYEPALFIGLLMSIAALIFKVIAGGEIGYEDIVLILTPLGAGAAIKPKVSSNRFIKNNAAAEDRTPQDIPVD